LFLQEGGFMEELVVAIEEKCRRDRWYGPDALSPQQYDEAWKDPDFDRQTLEMLDPHDPQQFRFAFPPASEAELVETEQKLGFALPPSLRTLYATLANGGFGPGLGLRGALHGYAGPSPHGGGSLLDYYPGGFSENGNTRYIDLQSLDQVTLLPYTEWPRELLQICDVGCCIEICLGPNERVYSVAPSEAHDRYLLTRLGWTLEEWLWRWLKGENYCWRDHAEPMK
jgi:hypothetical protein